MSSTRISRHVNAPRAIVYRALLDARAVATWMVPTGKTTAHTDTFHGRFVKLVQNEQVVEVVEFETTDPAMRGEMTITYSLVDTDGGTDIYAVHDGLPLGLSPVDNETGWQMSLAKLAALVEAGDK